MAVKDEYSAHYGESTHQQDRQCVPHTTGQDLANPSGSFSQKGKRRC